MKKHFTDQQNNPLAGQAHDKPGTQPAPGPGDSGLSAPTGQEPPFIPPPTENILNRPLDRGVLSINFDPAQVGMCPMSVEMLVVDEPTPSDLYLALYNSDTQRVEMRSVCAQGEPFRQLWRDRLKRADQQKVYVQISDARRLHDYFTQHSTKIIDDPRITRRKKVTVVQEMAMFNLQLFFSSSLEPRDLDCMVERSQDTVGRLARDPQVLNNLSEVLRTDYSTYAHSVNVCMLAMAFGTYLGLHPSRIHSLGMGGLLHDIGMARLPRQILDKCGDLNRDERNAIRRHPRLGYDMLVSISSIPYDVLMIILHHHENADGSGYPSGFTSARIPELAKLLRVVDSYDAMTSMRPYHDAKPAYEAATSLIESMSGKFGSGLVPKFIRFLGSPYIATV